MFLELYIYSTYYSYYSDIMVVIYCHLLSIAAVQNYKFVSVASTKIVLCLAPFGVA